MPTCLGFTLLQNWFSWRPTITVSLLCPHVVCCSDPLPWPPAGLSQNLPGASNSFHLLDLPALRVFSTGPGAQSAPQYGKPIPGSGFSCDPQYGWYSESRSISCYLNGLPLYVREPILQLPPGTPLPPLVPLLKFLFRVSIS